MAKDGDAKAEKRAKKAKEAPTAAEAAAAAVPPHDAAEAKAAKKRRAEVYEREIEHLQEELAHLQAWVKATGARIVVILEGRDAAGKGGVIRRMTERVSPRVFRVVALPAPTDREKTQVYMQRYIAHLPAAGEIVIFDRSWYNRAGVERVMGFCTEQEAADFLAGVPNFERYLINNGIVLIKFFLTVGMEEQEKRFKARIHDPLRQWKLSPMDLTSYRKWWAYTHAYDLMIRASDTPHAPWWIVPSDDKKAARVNCITQLLKLIPYERVPFEKPKLGKRNPRHEGCPDEDAAFRDIVPDAFGALVAAQD
jgi:polyphosphate kinase 2